MNCQMALPFPGFLTNFIFPFVETKSVLWYIDSNCRRKAVPETENKNKIDRWYSIISFYRHICQCKDFDSIV